LRPLVLSLLSLAISCAPASEVKARHDEILGGVSDTTTTSVFLVDLRFDTGASICTAVLITPRVLLLAAHCVDTVFHGATTLTARATNKPDTVMLMMSDMIDLTVISKHPNWNPADSTSDADIAVALLARAPTGVPAPILRALPAGAVGQMVQLVGYGRSSVNDGASSGVRRSVTLPITAIDAADFKYGSDGVAGICAGDSGGPSFLGGAVAGVHSRSEGSSCGLGVDMRVDRNLAFIDAFVAANDPPSCSSDGRCAPGCATTDPDCPTCVADQRCDPACGAADPDCRCLVDQRCDPTCGVTDPDCGDDGAVCTLAAECAGGKCLDDPRGFKFCSRSCVASGECVNDMTCQAAVCRAAPDPAKGGVAGGCSTAPGLLAWLLIVLLRRRRW
jgi:hypothetical protein